MPPPRLKAEAPAPFVFEEEAPKPLPPDNSPVIFLGLFLLILAFFIILNSLSSFEYSKAQDVISNVRGSFKSIAYFQKYEARAAQEELAGMSIVALHDKLMARIPFDFEPLRVVQNERTNTLEFRFTRQQFFANDNTLMPGAQAFLTQVVETLNQATTDTELYLEVTAPPPPLDQPQEHWPAAIIVRQLLDYGVAPTLLSGGHFTKENDLVVLLFGLREIDEAYYEPESLIDSPPPAEQTTTEAQP